jgi:hypothetical protein
MAITTEDKPANETEPNVYGPVWLVFSYDASEPDYDGDDFRKRIIRTLRSGHVVRMHEPVETTIYFLDPNTTVHPHRLCVNWKSKFTAYGKNFKYFIAPMMKYQSSGEPVFEQQTDDKLDKDFQALLLVVSEEPPPKKTS